MKNAESDETREVWISKAGDTRFDMRAFWEDRLRTLDLRAVGRVSASRSYNRWMYRIRKIVFKHAVRQAMGKRSVGRVLDVGSGTGFYVEMWKQLGAGRIAAMDITTAATDSLRKRHPDITVLRADVSDPQSFSSLGTFDAVSCMDVLFHLVDDETCERALRNLSLALAPDGILILSDVFIHGPTRKAVYIALRNLRQFEGMLKRSSLKPVYRGPFFAIMNEPHDSDNRLIHAYWRCLDRLALRTELGGFVVGAVLFPLEAGLVRILRESPTLEIMTCVKDSNTSYRGMVA